jgi:hypothetical protein
MTKPIILYVDPFPGGHHAEYLAFFLRALRAADAIVEAQVPAGVWREAIRLNGGENAAASLAVDLDLTGSTVSSRWRFIQALFQAATERSVALVFFAMVDPFVVPIAIERVSSGRALPNWSGIHFRGSFNYLLDELFRPLQLLKSLAKAAFLIVAAHNIRYGLFTLDSHWKLYCGAPIIWLPDALTSLENKPESEDVILDTTSAPLDSRMRLLFFGAIAERKGLREACLGLSRLEDQELASIRLDVLGKFDSTSYQVEVESWLDRLGKRGLSFSINPHYIPEEVLRAHLINCDVILAPYVDHVGSSAAVGLSALYGKPIIGQANYQMGAEIRKFSLGWTVSQRRPELIAEAVRSILRNRPHLRHGFAGLAAIRNPSAARGVIDSFFSGILADLGYRVPSDLSQI